MGKFFIQIDEANMYARRKTAANAHSAVVAHRWICLAARWKCLSHLILIEFLRPCGRIPTVWISTSLFVASMDWDFAWMPLSHHTPWWRSNYSKINFPQMNHEAWRRQLSLIEPEELVYYSLLPLSLCVLCMYDWFINQSLTYPGSSMFNTCRKLHLAHCTRNPSHWLWMASGHD